MQMLLIHVSTEQQTVLFHGTKLHVLVLKLGRTKLDFYQTHRSAKGASNAVTSRQAHQTPSCDVWQKTGLIGDSWCRNNPDRIAEALWRIFGAGYVTRGVLGWADWEGRGPRGGKQFPGHFVLAEGGEQRREGGVGVFTGIPWMSNT